jgi:hypothetical protein
MSRLITIVEGWLMLNVALAALLVYQNSPHLRHQLFRWTIGVDATAAAPIGTRTAQYRPSPPPLKELLIAWKRA